MKRKTEKAALAAMVITGWALSGALGYIFYMSLQGVGL
jgi:hypothetical protein